MRRDYEEEDDEEEEEEEEPDRGVIPEVVTNRMMSRMAVSVGIPLGIGLLLVFFVVLHINLLQLASKCLALFILQLGLVIDLTNTTRYYPVSDWTKEGIGHVKVAYYLSSYCL